MPVADIEQQVAVSAVHLGLMARLVAPALGAAVLGCPLDVRLGEWWWQDQPGGAVPLSVPLAVGGESLGHVTDDEESPLPGEAPGHATVDGQHPVPGEWNLVLIDELAAPVTAAIARLGSVSGRVLRGNVASAVNAAAAQLARQRPGPAFRRSSCCLFCQLTPGVADAVCGDCVLLGRRDRGPDGSRS